MRVNILKFFCLMGVLLSTVGCSEDGMATLTIVNQSNETIVLLQVTVNENIQTVKDLEHGEEAEMRFLVNHDTGYHLDIHFLSGRKMIQKIGYISYGFNVIDIITITKMDVEFERASIEMH